MNRPTLTLFVWHFLWWSNTFVRVLYIKTQWCFFFCPELIEEHGGARNVKFRTQVNNNEAIMFEDLSEIFTPRRGVDFEYYIYGSI